MPLGVGVGVGVGVAVGVAVGVGVGVGVSAGVAVGVGVGIVGVPASLHALNERIKKVAMLKLFAKPTLSVLICCISTL